jgi:hypothetical protein
MHAVDEVPCVVPIFNFEFNGHDLHSEPSEYKPVLQRHCVGEVEPGSDVDNGGHLLQVI